MAKIIIDVLAKDLREVLTNLKMSSEYTDDVKYTIELGIVDSKDNFEYLTKSGKVLNWDFLSQEKASQIEDESDIDPDCENYSPQPSKSRLSVSVLDDKPRALEIYNHFNHPDFIEDENNILKLIYVSWITKHKSPARLFTLCTLFSSNCIEAHTIKKDIAIYYPINKEILDNYYKDKPFEYILEDVIYKLHKIWNNLSNYHEFSNVINELLKL